MQIYVPRLPDADLRYFSIVETLQTMRTWIGCPMDGEGYPLRDYIKIAGLGEKLQDVRRI